MLCALEMPRRKLVRWLTSPPARSDTQLLTTGPADCRAFLLADESLRHAHQGRVVPVLLLSLK
jgi:hypothetical protein